MKFEKDKQEIVATFKGFVSALKKRVAASFRGIRKDMFLDPKDHPDEEPIKGGGNSTELLNRTHVEHVV